MRYPIGSLSKIIGISSEAIRMYEKKGVVASKRNPENGYRTFHTLDIGTLLRCKTYAAMGLSLNEAANLINAVDVERVHRCLSERESVMENEIERRQRELARLRDVNHQIKHCEQDVHSYRIEVHPGLYLLDYRHNEALIEDEERMRLYRQWADWAPLSFVSLRFPLEPLARKERDYYAGFGVMAEDARFLGIAVNECVRCFPSQLSLRGVLAIPGERPILPIDFDRPLEYIASSGYRLCGEPLTRMIVTVKRNAPDFLRYYEMWIPICK